jgi:hypothetical protein
MAAYGLEPPGRRTPLPSAAAQVDQRGAGPSLDIPVCLVEHDVFSHFVKTSGLPRLCAGGMKLLGG